MESKSPIIHGKLYWYRPNTPEYFTPEEIAEMRADFTTDVALSASDQSLEELQEVLELAKPIIDAWDGKYIESLMAEFFEKLTKSPSFDVIR